MKILESENPRPPEGPWQALLREHFSQDDHESTACEKFAAGARDLVLKAVIGSVISTINSTPHVATLNTRPPPKTSSPHHATNTSSGEFQEKPLDWVSKAFSPFVISTFQKPLCRDTERSKYGTLPSGLTGILLCFGNQLFLSFCGPYERQLLTM